MFRPVRTWLIAGLGLLLVLALLFPQQAALFAGAAAGWALAALFIFAAGSAWITRRPSGICGG